VRTAAADERRRETRAHHPFCNLHSRISPLQDHHSRPITGRGVGRHEVREATQSVDGRSEKEPLNNSRDQHQKGDREGQFSFLGAEQEKAEKEGAQAHFDEAPYVLLIARDLGGFMTE